MCEYCHSYPHLAGCPNAPEPKAVHECKDCGEGILPGEEFVEIDGEYYHYDCLSNMSTRDLLELFGAEVHEAEEEECDYDEVGWASGF